MKSASSEERAKRGEVRSGFGESERESSLSNTDLQEETRLECFRHAAFLMILSRDGPTTRPLRDGPPRVWEADINSDLNWEEKCPNSLHYSKSHILLFDSSSAYSCLLFSSLESCLPLCCVVLVTWPNTTRFTTPNNWVNFCFINSPPILPSPSPSSYRLVVGLGRSITYITKREKTKKTLTTKLNKWFGNWNIWYAAYSYVSIFPTDTRGHSGDPGFASLDSTSRWVC